MIPRTSHLVPRLCLGTHFPRGSASLKDELMSVASRVGMREAEPPEKCVPRQSLGTRRAQSTALGQTIGSRAVRWYGGLLANQPIDGAKIYAGRRTGVDGEMLFLVGGAVGRGSGRQAVDGFAGDPKFAGRGQR